MKACLDPDIPVLSPALETRVLTGFALAAAVGYFIATGDMQEEIVSTEIYENVANDAGILGGAASLFGGLKAMQGEMETAAETASEIESAPFLIGPLINNLRLGIQFFLEAIGLL